MAFYKCICILVTLITLIRGDMTNTEWTTVYIFNPLDAYNNFLVLKPKVPISNSTGYSVCLRVTVWEWNHTVVFDSPALKLEMYVKNTIEFCLYKNQKEILLCFTLDNESLEWNTICFTHNFTDFLLKVTLNGQPKGYRIKRLNSTFLDELNKTIAIGEHTSFWGQITDFNIWNRPLSNDEVNQYSFGCQRGLSTQPEILDWSTASIFNLGTYSRHFKIRRQLLSCQNGITPFSLYENANLLGYTDSTKFCKFLRGDLFDSTYVELGQNYGNTSGYWVPSKKSEENGTSQFENSTQLEEQTINLTTGQKTDPCMYIVSNGNKSLDCTHKNPSVCKVPKCSS